MLRKQELSVLLPSYNCNCVEVVARLCALCSRIDGLTFEVIVADDGSTDKTCIAHNKVINSMEHCRFLCKEKNEGAGTTRNFLAAQSRYKWLLYLDGDMELPDKLIERYVTGEEEPVINGGLKICPDEHPPHNLRYQYEIREAHKHTATKRSKCPYHAFRSTNFMVRRDVMQAAPFDVRLRRYEDVLFGKHMQKLGIPIVHIDNPVVMADIESNADYLTKVEKDMDTLYQFRSLLTGFSPLLTLAENLERWHLSYSVRIWHRLFGSLERRNLAGTHPILPLLNLYKLGYFLALAK